MKLYNTLSREKEDFKPISKDEVKIYTCGLTVYSEPHIGNWVPYIYWDVLQRVLMAEGYKVNRVQNITDVGHLVSDDDSGEDKMEKGAKAEGITAWDVANKYIKIADEEAYQKLGLLKPKMIRATDKIQEQIDFVKELEDKEYTYKIDGEGIYFDTSKLKDYGKLARLDISGLEAGARVSVDGKRNITDFALWKFSPADQQRDMEWDSPWGKGFPGWHLECSVIAQKGLGDQIDIHTGGIDHIPVHHTNEIAQTESLTEKSFANFWLHNNHIKVDSKKMSKSLGNIYTLKDIENKGFDLQAFKLMLLSKHYRTEGNFTWEILEAAQNRLNGYKKMAANVWQPRQGTEHFEQNYFEDKQRAIMKALSDDLNTPAALVIISEVESIIEKQHLHDTSVGSFQNFLDFLDTTLGLKLQIENISEGQTKTLEQRQKARDAKSWAQSDQLRDQLHEQGIGIDDSSAGQTWYRI